MKLKSFLLPVLFCATLSLSAQNNSAEFNNDDILKALKLMGVELFKVPLSSHNQQTFNLILSEYRGGIIVESTPLLDTSQLDMLRRLNLSLLIEPDTNYLRIITTKKNDSTFTLNLDYSNINFAEQNIITSINSNGSFRFHLFKTPKIETTGDYPLLLLAGPWTHEIKGDKVIRYCYTESLDEIKVLIDHFFVVSLTVGSM